LRTSHVHRHPWTKQGPQMVSKSGPKTNWRGTPVGGPRPAGSISGMMAGLLILSTGSCKKIPRSWVPNTNETVSINSTLWLLAGWLRRLTWLTTWADLLRQATNLAKFVGPTNPIKQGSRQNNRLAMRPSVCLTGFFAYSVCRKVQANGNSKVDQPQVEMEKAALHGLQTPGSVYLGQDLTDLDTRSQWGGNWWNQGHVSLVPP